MKEQDDKPIPPAGSTSASKVPELTITRVFDAPRTLVFQAWTEPRHLVHWWGPRGFSTPTCKMDATPGSAYQFRMRASDGREVLWQGVCREISPPERLVWTCTIQEPSGNLISAETILSVTLEEQGDKTKMTLHQAVFDSVANYEGHQNGWDQAMSRLAEYLPNL